MKLLNGLAAVVAMTVSMNAMAGNISCEAAYGERGNVKRVITLEGLLITDWIKDARAAIVTGGEVKEEGRAAELMSQDNSRAKKYKDFYKFDLSDLTETKKFGSFTPIDYCSIKVFIPLNAMELTQFKAPSTINCDQQGGSAVFYCSHTK